MNQKCGRSEDVRYSCHPIEGPAYFVSHEMSLVTDIPQLGGAGPPQGASNSRKGQAPDCLPASEGEDFSLVRCGPSGPATTRDSYLQTPSASPDDLVNQGANSSSISINTTIFPVSMVPGDTPLVFADIPENNYLKYWRLSPVNPSLDSDSDITEVTQSSLDDENILVKVQALHGCYESVKSTRNGLLIRVNSRAMAERLQQIQIIGKTKVKVTPNDHLNFAKGVISSSEFRGITDTDLNSMFSPIATEVKRLMKKTKDGLIPSNSLILTFRASVLPKSVKFGYLSFKVKPYLRNPMRCFNCQRYGHTNTRCHKSRRCGQCGSEDQNHPDSRSCSNDPCCPHCDKSHPVWDRSCEALIREKELIRIMYDYKQPRREAITTWENQHQDTFLSYKKTSFATKASDPVPASAPSTAPRGGYAPRGAGRGRGGRGSSHSSRPHSHSHSDSHSFLSTNQFAALTDSIETPAEVSDTNSKKRTHSTESTESATVKPPKLKINRSSNIKPLGPARHQLIHGDTTYFHGGDSPFSNFHRHKKIPVHAPKDYIKSSGVMTNNELEIDCVEKLYQFRKAFYFKDISQCQKIYNEGIPPRIKVLGKHFDGKKNVWHKVAVGVMCECQFRKYSIPTLRQKLISKDSSTNYVELTRYDSFWGSGSDNIGEGQGENWMGKILNNLRLYLLGQLPDTHEFKLKFDNIKTHINNKNHEYFEIVLK